MKMKPTKTSIRLCAILLVFVLLTFDLIGCTKHADTNEALVSNDIALYETPYNTEADATSTPASETPATDVPTVEPTESPTEPITPEATLAQSTDELRPSGAPEDDPTVVQTPSHEEFVAVNGEKAYINRSYVNLRQQPTTESDIVKRLTYATEAVINAESDNWYKVNVGESEGYIAKPYLTRGEVLTPVPTATPKPTPAPTPTSVSFTKVNNVAAYTNRAYVNLRSEPSTESEIITVMPYGTNS